MTDNEMEVMLAAGGAGVLLVLFWALSLWALKVADDRRRTRLEDRPLPEDVILGLAQRYTQDPGLAREELSRLTAAHREIEYGVRTGRPDQDAVQQRDELLRRLLQPVAPEYTRARYSRAQRRERRQGVAA